ncbi:hypothetical protein JCM8097_004280 [Rhodosporidiobolus ruineniae]
MVLRKPKKLDYTHSKAYRLISFERTTAKLVEKIMATRLSYLAEKHELLSASHFGGRKGRVAVEAVAAAVDVSKRQHRIGNHFVFGLAVDIAGAFPSISAAQLDRNLRAKNVPLAARRFIRSWINARTVTISLDGSSITVPATGLPQGSALSPITYCLYHAPALEAAEKRGRSCGFGWIDNLNLFAWGKTVSEAADNLSAIIPDLESWSSTHKSRFEPTDGAKLPYSPSLTMLGTILDKRPTCESHAALCATKASTALNGRESARLVSGCFRTTALDAMEVEAGLTPVEVALETAAALLAIRALSAPRTHPVHTPTRLAVASPAPKYPSPIHSALSSPFLPPFPQPLELLDAKPTATWSPWPTLETMGVVSTDKARDRHDRNLRELKDGDQVAYSDGSEMEGLTGAGLAIRLGGGDGAKALWAKKAVGMGRLQGVYPAELVGLNLAIAAVPAPFTHPTLPLPSPSSPTTRLLWMRPPTLAPAQHKLSALTPSVASAACRPPTQTSPSA